MNAWNDFKKSPPGLWKSAWTILAKDLLIEWRTRSRLNALIFFAISTLLIFAFALGPNTVLLRQNASAYLWLGVLFASVLSLGESFRIEAENSAMEGLRQVPTSPRAIFLGKAIGNTLLLFALSVVMLPVTVAIYDVTIVGETWKLVTVFLLG